MRDNTCLVTPTFNRMSTTSDLPHYTIGAVSAWRRKNEFLLPGVGAHREASEMGGPGLGHAGNTRVIQAGWSISPQIAKHSMSALVFGDRP